VLVRHSSCLGVDVADNSKLLLLGGAAVAVWWFYFRTPTAAATPAAAAASTTGGTSTPPAGPKMPSVSDIQAAVILAANAPMEGLSVDSWGWYLNNALAPYGVSAPDPMPLFTARAAAANAALAAVPGYSPVTFNRSELVTAPAYWVVMEPALKAQLGLSGLGLYRWVQ
jgi:hypothetical protein